MGARPTVPQVDKSSHYYCCCLNQSGGVSVLQVENVHAEYSRNCNSDARKLLQVGGVYATLSSWQLSLEVSTYTHTYI